MWGCLACARQFSLAVSQGVGVRWWLDWGQYKASFTHMSGAWARKTQTAMRRNVWGSMTSPPVVCLRVCMRACVHEYVVSPWVPPYGGLMTGYLYSAEGSHIWGPKRYWKNAWPFLNPPSEVKQHHFGHILCSCDKVLWRFKGMVIDSTSEMEKCQRTCGKVL